MEETDVLPVAIATTKTEPTCVQISAAEPCNSVSTGLQCEMDPVSQTQACDVLSSLGFSVVGWYHSHPTFHPNPSVRDINTQDQFQVKETQRGGHLERVVGFSLFLLLQSYFSRGGAPFIGMIVSPYDPANPSPHSQTTCLLVKASPEHSSSQSKFNADAIRMLLIWKVVSVDQSVEHLTQSFSPFFPRAALQIWFQIVTRHSRLGTDDEESPVDHPQILPISSVSAQ